MGAKMEGAARGKRNPIRGQVYRKLDAFLAAKLYVRQACD